VVILKLLSNKNFITIFSSITKGLCYDDNNQRIKGFSELLC